VCLRPCPSHTVSLSRAAAVADLQTAQHKDNRMYCLGYCSLHTGEGIPELQPMHTLVRTLNCNTWWSILELNRGGSSPACDAASVDTALLAASERATARPRTL
jgi:hypothetical protein